MSRCIEKAEMQTNRLDSESSVEKISLDTSLGGTSITSGLSSGASGLGSGICTARVDKGVTDELRDDGEVLCRGVGEGLCGATSDMLPFGVNGCTH